MSSFRLIYCSQIVPPLDRAGLDAILVSARRHNDRNGLTGCLYFDGYHFVQALEGGSQDVNETYQRISRDGRHHTITLLSFGAVNTRIALHAMALAERTGAVELALDALRNPEGHFVPERFGPAQAQMFMQLCGTGATPAP